MEGYDLPKDCHLQPFPERWSFCAFGAMLRHTFRPGEAEIHAVASRRGRLFGPRSAGLGLPNIFLLLPAWLSTKTHQDISLPFGFRVYRIVISKGTVTSKIAGDSDSSRLR